MEATPRSWKEPRVFPAVLQQLLVIKEEKQRKGNPSMEQQHPEPLHIKEEQHEVWSSQEGEQLHRLEEPDITRFPSTAVPVKSEDEEKPQCSQLHQSQTEDNREADPPTSSSATQIKTGSGGEDCGGSEAARNQDPDGHSLLSTDEKASDSSETENSDDEWQEPLSDCESVWKETRAPESDGNGLKYKEDSDKNSYRCSECGKQLQYKWSLHRHMMCHLVKSPSSCLVKKNCVGVETDSQMRVHVGGKPFGCDVCGKTFNCNTDLKRHARVHTGEKPFGCYFCGVQYNFKTSLTRHMRVHTGEKPFGCEVCGKQFTCTTGLKRHRLVHTGEKPFGCEVCGKRFNLQRLFKTHMRVHTGEKPFVCGVCGKRFTHQTDLMKHTRVHTGEKPFGCGVCGKQFNCGTNMKRHMKVHTGEKPFGCDVCGKRFIQQTHLRRHMKVHTL